MFQKKKTNEAKELILNPLCDLFDAMSEEEYVQLRDSIRQHGQLVPIQLDADGRILDGRHRYRACMELRLAPVTRGWHGRSDMQTYADYVCAVNLTRRHLTASQRALIANKLATAVQGRRGSEKDDCPATTIEDAAKAVGVSPRMVHHARQLVRESPELAEKVRAGEITLTQAVRQVEEEETESVPEERIHDAFGHELTGKMADTFMSSPILTEIKNEIDKLRREVTELCESGHPVAAYVNEQEFTATMKSAAALLRFAVPHCLCPKCSGDGCDACRSSGWMPKSVYEQTIPDELRWERGEK